MNRYRKWEKQRIVERVIRRLDGIQGDLDPVVFWNEVKEEEEASWNRYTIWPKRAVIRPDGIKSLIVDFGDVSASLRVGMIALDRRKDLYYCLSIAHNVHETIITIKPVRIN